MGQLENLWDEATAAALGAPERLLYRSNLLGSDKRVTNYGGGNTSSKLAGRDPLTGDEVTVLWVKGSGGDVGTMKLDGFATLYLDRLEALKALYRGPDHEDEMVGYLPHCTFDLNPRAASIDTPLHAYLPYPYVDHMHPDAIIAIAASQDSRALTAEVFGDRIGWLPWRRPGFELGLMLERFARENPEAEGVILESHGLFTWGASDRACYENTIATINQAIDWLQTRSGGSPAFGGPRVEALDADARRAAAERLMPAIRGLIGGARAKVGHFDDQPAVLDFVNSARVEELAALGTSCPDHFLRTKIRPLVLAHDMDAEAIAARIATYREDYAAYYDRCKQPDSPAMRDPNAVIYLVPQVGMISFAGDKATARISAEFYVNAINVMRGSSAVSTYTGLPEQEAFDIEYWLLEEAKLQRMPKPKALAGRVALVTGAAGGIGSATAGRLLGEGACVVLADIDTDALEATRAGLAGQFSADQVRAVALDVTQEAQVADALAAAAREYGGLDILVSNAGISSSAPLDETGLDMWNRNMSILATGYFLVTREAFRLMKRQGLGGSVVFIASKNALAASPNAAAYCTAKAAEVHLARCVALEGAPLGIRVNTVNPDAVLRGSKIWDGEWREQRAAAYNMAPGDLEEHYRKRSLLQRSVFPEDIAEAVYFLVSDASAKSTGNIINVDAGNAQSFTR
jgi:rhamnulose-1-phosphate aldolase/alcohol dehydrogenase